MALPQRRPSGFGKLAAFAFNRTYTTADVIVEEGQTGNEMYMITEGKVEVIMYMGTPGEQRVGHG